MKTSTTIWFDAIRPKTLPLAFASIFCGNALAYENGGIEFSILILTILTALSLQILSNLANDYGDGIKGTDNEQRIGPVRALQSGQVNRSNMKTALFINLIVTVLLGSTLIFLSCQHTTDILIFFIFGILAIIASITYTIGNKPYGYSGLGDIAVLIFFGWLGVAGSYYLQTGSFDQLIILPATATGLLAVSVLNINNLRDIENDRQCHKRTLVVRLGFNWGKHYHVMLLSIAIFCFLIFNYYQHSWSGLIILIAIPFLYKHAKSVYYAQNSLTIAPKLAEAAKYALLTNLLFILGLVLF